MKVLIVVTHLLGTGHLTRAATLGRAFAAEGQAVTLASGGMPLARLDATGLDLRQLPPLRSDGVDFARLLTSDGAVAGEPILASRRDTLLALLEEVAPDILITELYPFGRRILSAEFLSLLGAARARAVPPVILSSVRDILAPPSKPAKAERAEQVLLGQYDGVLVHSDETVTPLDTSWPVTEAMRRLLRYTGYVAPAAPAPHPARVGEGEILVSAGGGPVGDALFAAAQEAAAVIPDRPWRLLVGGDPARAKEFAGPNVIAEPARPDFRSMLPLAAASVSMCGYNTALDLMQTGVPSVLVPFDDGGEVEQTLRARALAAMPGVEVIASADLTPQRMADAVARVIAAPRRTDAVRFDGAARSVALAVAMAKVRA